MKSLIFAFAAFIAGTCACYSGPVIRTAPTSLLENLADSTAALVTEDSEGNTKTFCSAVWVDTYTLLTAAHCVEAVVDEDQDAVGQRIEYITQPESNGPGNEPKAKHVGLVRKVDEAHDLASIKTGVETPIHSVAVLGLTPPHVGDELHFFGHPSGFSWTYTHGWCSAYRAVTFVDEKLGPWMQVSAPIWFGNSGGGAFAADGSLVGIASFKPKAPSIAFYVHLDTIKAFLLT